MTYPSYVRSAMTLIDLRLAHGLVFETAHEQDVLARRVIASA